MNEHVIRSRFGTSGRVGAFVCVCADEEGESF